MRCEELRAIAAELALDELTGTERAAALDHLGSCAACRAEVADLAAIADSLLLLAPPLEPPAGFESRVVNRITPVASPRRWWAPTAAAAVAVIVGGVAGFVVRGAGDADDLPAAAVLLDGRGNPAGSVVLADEPDRMTCVFEGERFGGGYRVEVVDHDGDVAAVGSFSFERVPWSWTVELPVDAGDVRLVRVHSDDGTLRATAELD